MKAYVNHYSPDILAISKTWGRPALADSLITPAGYTLFRRDRQDRVGGGVALLVRDCFHPLAFSIPDSVDVFEASVWCVIPLPSGKKLLTGCVYRSTSSDTVNDANL